MRKFTVKNIVTNLSILLVTLAIVFIIGEIIVRALYKQETVLFPRYHTDVKYGEYTLRRIRPNSEFWHTSRDGSWKFTTNNRGFRNVTDFTYEKPKEILRVLSIGDSHTQGYEVRQEYTFSAVAEKYLNLHGVKAEVINAGVSGFSTAEELLFLENEGIKYKPDVVLLGFYANDYEDNLKANFFKLDENGNLLINKKEHIPGVKIQNFIYEIPFVKWMSENSYFYSVMFNATWLYFKTKSAKEAKEKVTEYAIPTEKIHSNYQTSLTAALIERMYKFCQKNDIKLIILDIPQTNRKKEVSSSFSQPIHSVVTKNSDAYFTADMLFKDYIGVAELFLPHGHHHISEFTHTIYGVTIAKKILELN